MVYLFALPLPVGHKWFRVSQSPPFFFFKRLYGGPELPTGDLNRMEY